MSRKLKNILVPTDFSKTARNALKYAAELAKREEAKIILFHAAPVHQANPVVPPKVMEESDAVYKQKALDQLKTLSRAVKRTLGVDCECLVKQDYAVQGILDVVRSHAIDLVVTGTRGASGIKAAFLGSNSANVIAQAKCPVLAVPDGAKFKGFNHIIFATDFLESDIVAISLLTEFAKVFKARYTLLHIIHETETKGVERELMESFRTRLRKKVKTSEIEIKVVTGWDVEETIGEFVQGKACDLLVMSTVKSDSPFSMFFSQSPALKMANHPKVPLMVFHFQEDPILEVDL